MLLLRLIYFAIAGICIAISVYLTYMGFYTTFQELTLLFTAVIGLGLVGADLLVQRYREAGQSIMIPMILFGITAFFSITSNFNHLYTNFMRNTVMEETLTAQLDIFRTDLTATRDRLTDLPSVRDSQNEYLALQTELDNLRAQVNDPVRPGCGARCRAHISSINAMLSTPVTDLAAPPLNASQSQIDQFLSTFETQAIRSFNSQAGTETFVRTNEIVRQIDSHLDKYDSVDELIETDDQEDGSGLKVLADLARLSEDIERQANTMLARPRVQHKEIDPTLGRLGEIVYSLQNGFVERPNMGATVFSLIAASIVDFFPIIFALIVFRADTPVDAPVEEDEFL